jgi:hypothetical protein
MTSAGMPDASPLLALSLVCSVGVELEVSLVLVAGAGVDDDEEQAETLPTNATAAARNAT